MKTYHIIIVFLIFSVLFPVFLFSDQREENLDVFVVLDKSLSMKQEIGEVKSYVNDYIIDQQLIPGDMFILIAFYGNAEVVVEEQRVGENRNELKQKVSTINANGRFTDIAHALDTLRETLQEYEGRDRRRYLLLLTDGIQEAPPGSKYYTEDGSFTHEFLANVKTIQKEGWKVQILGIGTESAAKEMAEQLSGEYSETSDSPTKEELVEKTKDLIGTLEIEEGPKLHPVDASGRSELVVTLKSKHYTTAKNVTITDILLEISPHGQESIIKEPYSVTVEPGASESFTIPVMVPFDLNPGTYEGTLTFRFSGEGGFVPSIAEVRVPVKSFLENNVWVFPVGIGALLALALAVFFVIRKIATDRGVRFRIYVDNTPISREPLSLKKDETLFLDLERRDFSVSEQRSENTVAQLTLTEGKLRFAVIDEDAVKISEEIPENVLGGKVTLKLKTVTKTLSFKNA
jgi:Mg-chelatase subunit ChlD